MSDNRHGDPDFTKARNEVLKILRSKECDRIHFTAYNIRVTGSGFRSVAEAIEREASDKITIDVDPIALKLEHAHAAYDPIGRILKLRSGDFHGPRAQVLEQKSQVVHESTHAQVHQVYGGQVENVVNETAAHIAQQIYLALVGGRPRPGDRYAAAAVLAKKALATKSSYAFTPSELSDLLAAIKVDYGEDALREGDEAASDQQSEQESPVGKWRVLCGKNPRPDPNDFKYEWIYVFKKNGQVTWVDAHNSKKGGSGLWKMYRSRGYFTTAWSKSTTTELWAIPTNTAYTDPSGKFMAFSSSKIGGSATMKEGPMYLSATRM